VVEAWADEIGGETVKKEDVREEPYKVIEEKGNAAGDEPNAGS
jgi:hypothetical protein